MNLLEELLKVQQAQQNPTLPGPLNNLPTGVKRTLGVMGPVAGPLGALATVPGQVGQELGNKALDNPLGKAAIAAMLVQSDRLANTPAGRDIGENMTLFSLLNKAYGSAQVQAARNYATTQGTPEFDRLQAAHEAGAAGNEKAMAVADAVIDPINLLGPLGKLAELGKLGKVGRVLSTVDRVSNLPAEGAIKGVTRAARPVLQLLAEQQAARAAITTPSERAAGKLGGVARKDLPQLVEGLRGYGPSELETVPPPAPPLATLPDLGPPPAPPISLPDVLAQRQSKALPTKRPVDIQTRIKAQLGLPSAPLTPNENPPVPALDRVRALIQGEADRVGTLYPPHDAQFYVDRAGVTAEEVPDLLRQLVDEGTLGYDHTGALALKPAPRATSASLLDEGVPPEAISLDEERAAQEAWQGTPQLAEAPRPVGSQEFPASGVGDLNDDEIMRLVEVAYGSEEAVGNALLKRQNPIDLANRAIERITTDRRKLLALGEAYPDLAEKIAMIDLPGESALASGYGDIAAGGGMGIVNGAIGRTLTGAVAGGALGAAGGALADDEDRTRGALVGAGLGAAAGGNVGAISPEIAQAARGIAPAIGAAVKGTALEPAMWEDAIAHGIAAQEAAAGNTGVKGLKATNDAFWQQQRAQVVNTLKQIPQDAFTQLVTRLGVAGQEFGITGADTRRWQTILRQERAAGLNGASSLQNPVTQRLRALGNTNALAKPQEYFGVDFGTELGQTQQEFTGKGRALAGAVIGAANGAKTMNPVAPLYGAVRGYFAPFVDGVIRFVNGIQHDAFRYSMVEKALDQRIPVVASAFLDGLDRQGLDTTALRSLGGYFSADEVRAIAGPQAAQEWDLLQETAVRSLGDRVAFLAGDFRDKLDPDYGGKVTGVDRVVSKFERGIGKYVPFARWQIRYTPVLAEIAARHPLATLYALKGIQAGVEDARENNLKSYQAGTTAISTDDPTLGGLAKARMAGVPGVVRANLLGLVSPYGSDMFVGEELPEDPTGYQRVTNALGKTGFSPAPPIQALAYMTGQDFKAPSALSRTAPLEALADVPPIIAQAILRGMGHGDLADKIPLMPQIPSGRAALDAGRDLLSTVTGASKSGNTDPATRRYAELVLARTKKPLSDPANVAYLEAVGNEAEPLWQQAVIEQRTMGAVGNAVGMVSPVSTTAQTREAVASQAAGKLPYTYQQIADAPKAAQPQMEAANKAAIQANPALGTYTDIGGYGRKEALIKEWERRNAGLKRLTPSLYQERLKAYKDSIK